MIFRFATLWHWSQNSGRLLRTWRRFCQAPCQRCFLQWHLEHRNLLHHGFKLERRRGLIHRIGCTNKGDRRCKNSWIFLSRKGAPKDLNANTVNSCDIMTGMLESQIRCWAATCSFAGGSLWAELFTSPSATEGTVFQWMEVGMMEPNEKLMKQPTPGEQRIWTSDNELSVNLHSTFRFCVGAGSDNRERHHWKCCFDTQKQEQVLDTCFDSELLNLTWHRHGGMVQFLDGKLLRIQGWFTQLWSLLSWRTRLRCLSLWTILGFWGIAELLTMKWLKDVGKR